MNLLKKIVIIVLLLATKAILFAHPHLFAGVDIDYDVTLNDTLVITQRWMFDDLTSMIILEDYDLNSDDEINAEELAEIKASVIPGIKEKNFYTDLAINDKMVIVDKIYNFSVGSDDIYVYYKFDMKVPFKFDVAENTVKVNIYDRDFYTKFFVNADSGLKITKPDDVSYTFDVYENPDKSYYFGQLSPLEVKLTLRKD